MSILSELRERARALLFRASEDRELEEEIRFHIERETERLVREGVPPTEARRQALVTLGGVDRFTEQVREARGVLWLENALRDLRLGARGLRREPGFTTVAVLTLAVGIGATTTVFALVNGVLLRPVPAVPDQDELFVVRLEEAPGDGTGISIANIEELRSATPSLTGLAAHQGTTVAAATYVGATTLRASFVEGDYFGVLELRPHVGRWFTVEEWSPTATGDVAVVSERVWTDQFGGTRDVLGRELRLNGAAYRIVGVAPPGFKGIERLPTVDVWLPPGAYNRVRHAQFDVRRDGLFFELIGRLAPGSGFERAEAELRAAMARLVELDPEGSGTYADNVPTVYPGIGLDHVARAPYADRARLLLGVVSILLLIACANVANLLLFRSLARRSEGAVRRALGASSGRLLQQRLAEGLLLSGLGALGGVVLAMLLRGTLEGRGLPGLPAIDRLTLDGQVLAFAAGAALLGGALATLLPAVLSLRGDPAPAVKPAEHSARAGAITRSALTVVQIGASLTLLVAALLLVRTVGNLSRLELGYEPEGVIAFDFDPGFQGYDPDRRRALERQLLERLEALSGVELGSVSFGTPLSPVDRVEVRRPEEQEGVDLYSLAVSADYLELVGIPVVAGRDFTREEGPGGPDSGILLSRSAARALFGEADPLGRVVDFGGFLGSDAARFVVIGIAGDVRRDGLRGEVRPTAYVALGSGPEHIIRARRDILVRSNLPVQEVDRMVRQAFAEIDPGVPLSPAEPLADAVRDSVAREETLARVLGLFAVLAVVLAGSGLYGVVAYSVARRRREIGVRVALGASQAAVVSLVARHALSLTGLGAAAGVAGAYTVSRLLESQLFGVGALDPVTYLLALAGLVAVAALASAVPARAAAKLDPVATLRTE